MAITFSLLNQPSGVTIDSGTGEITLLAVTGQHQFTKVTENTDTGEVFECLVELNADIGEMLFNCGGGNCTACIDGHLTDVRHLTESDVESLAAEVVAGYAAANSNACWQPFVITVERHGKRWRLEDADGGGIYKKQFSDKVVDYPSGGQPEIPVVEPETVDGLDVGEMPINIWAASVDSSGSRVGVTHVFVDGGWLPLIASIDNTASSGLTERCYLYSVPPTYPIHLAGSTVWTVDGLDFQIETNAATIDSGSQLAELITRSDPSGVTWFADGNNVYRWVEPGGCD